MILILTVTSQKIPHLYHPFIGIISSHATFPMHEPSLFVVLIHTVTFFGSSYLFISARLSPSDLKAKLRTDLRSTHRSYRHLVTISASLGMLLVTDIWPSVCRTASVQVKKTKKTRIVFIFLVSYI